jgi:hypothetical protein
VCDFSEVSSSSTVCYVALVRRATELTIQYSMFTMTQDIARVCEV